MIKFINQHQVEIYSFLLSYYLYILDRDRDNEIAAAVAYCSHFLLIISQLIDLPLRFPIDCHGMPAIKIYDYSLETTE
jgi:hypothetical protein